MLSARSAVRAMSTRTALGSVPGTMMDRPLTLTSFFDRAEQIFFDSEIVTSTVADGLVRTTYGDWAERSRRLGGLLDNLGLEPGARVGTFAWNTAQHLELWFAGRFNAEAK